MDLLVLGNHVLEQSGVSAAEPALAESAAQAPSSSA
jgi:hypothetical protein